MKELQSALNTLLNENLIVDGLIGVKTQNAINKLRGQIEKDFKKKGYQFNHSNLVCIRLDDVFDNKFTDICFVNIGTQNYAFNISTLAGLYGKGNVFNPNWIDGVFGVGVVKEGNYPKAYQLNTGWWTGLPFLYQIADFEYYRDGNLDITLNRAKVYKGKKGFNFHSWRGFIGNVVNNLSQGCMVAQQSTYESLSIPLFQQLAKDYKNEIDFTLLHKRDFTI
jgi:hypothetical protein